MAAVERQLLLYWRDSFFNSMVTGGRAHESLVRCLYLLLITIFGSVEISHKFASGVIAANSKHRTSLH